MKVNVRFLDSGKWQDKPWEPCFDVSAGDVREVSVELAHVACNSGRGEVVHRVEVDGLTGPTPEIIKGAEEYKLEDIGLVDALVKKLIENGVKSVKQLTEMTAAQVLELNGIGQGKVDDIEHALGEIKLSFVEGN